MWLTSPNILTQISTLDVEIRYPKKRILSQIPNRVRPRFFDQVGHETMYASSENKHFFTKSCHLTKIMNNLHKHLKICTFKLTFIKKCF